MEKKGLDQYQEVLFFDELHVNQKPNCKKGWSRSGHPPIVTEGTSRKGIPIQGALSLEGKISYSQQEGRLDSGSTKSFLRQLLRTYPGRLLVVWDNAPIHTSKEVKDFLNSKECERLEVMNFPPYAPELNPVEYVWNYLKNHRLGSVATFSLEELRYEVKKGMENLRQKTSICQGFIRHAKI